MRTPLIQAVRFPYNFEKQRRLDWDYYTLDNTTPKVNLGVHIVQTLSDDWR